MEFFKMCLGGGGGNTDQIAQQQLQLAQQQNAELEQQNAEKKANILAGNTSIENAFAQFNPAYYNKYQTDYTKAETTPLADQYTRAKDLMAGGLAGRGMGSSSVGNQAMADLDQRDATEIGKITNDAANAANTQRSTVENAKTNLYGLNAAGNDPTGISANAIGSASALVNPQPSPPIGNVFADLLTPIGNYYRAGQGGILGNFGVTGQPAVTGQSGVA